MTAQARITQADMDRAVKAAAKAERARIVMRLATGEIEIIIGEPAGESEPDLSDWSDDDV